MIIKIHLTIKGGQKDIENFINNFIEKGFESYIPAPQALKVNNTETPIHHLIIESLLQTESYNIYSNEKLKQQLYEKIKNILETKQFNPEIQQEVQQIYHCLQTGYFSLYDFGFSMWGCKLNATNIKKINQNTLFFETTWNVPYKFFQHIVNQIPLHFILNIYDENNVLIDTIEFKKKS